MNVNNVKHHVYKRTSDLGEFPSESSVRIQPEKIQIVLQMTRPKSNQNKIDLQSFLGMMTFLGKASVTAYEKIAGLTGLIELD